MDLPQLKTFVTVAREGSITRASELLFRSQPAISAHIKCLEETLGLKLFQRTPRGMTVTVDGQRLLTEAQQLLERHQRFLQSASRLRGNLAGQLCLGAGRNSGATVVSNLLLTLSRQFPEVEVELQHRSSHKVLEGIRNGSLDAGFFTETGEEDAEISGIEISRFRVYLAAPPGMVTVQEPIDWQALEDIPWIYPASNSCCGKLAQELLETHGIRPERVINVDDESVTRTLIAAGVGVGLIHVNAPYDLRSHRDVLPVCQVRESARVLFGHLRGRTDDPVISTVRSILEPQEERLLSFAEGKAGAGLQTAS